MPMHYIPSSIFTVGCENDSTVFPFFDIANAEISLAAVFYKPPLPTLFGRVGCPVNAKVSNGRIRDNSNLQMHGFFRVGFNVNIAVSAECLSHKAIIACYLAFVNYNLLRVHGAQGKHKQ